MEELNRFRQFLTEGVIKENMYIDDEEFEMEMGRSKKDSFKKRNDDAC